jgi:hypothetical protein
MGRFRESVVVDQPPDAVFASITDQGRISEWNDHVQRAEVVGGGPVDVGSRLRQHRRRNKRDFALDFVVTAHEPPSRHVVEGTVIGVETTMTFLVEPVGKGSRVTMDADVRGHGVRRVFAPIVTREMKRSTVRARRAVPTARRAPLAARRVAGSKCRPVGAHQPISRAFGTAWQLPDHSRARMHPR